MAATLSRPKFVVIVGPTASGKTKLALRIAKLYGGEIISGDSRTIYKGMDIGTAKLSSKDMAGIKHWGIDLVEPVQGFTVKQFKDYAEQKINEIQARGNLPILVGGTGLYIDSLLFNFRFRPKGDNKKRKELEKLEVEELKTKIGGKGYKLPENHQNKRHLIRVLESAGRTGSRQERPANSAIIIGLKPGNDVLKINIEKRAAAMLKKGLVKETAELLRSCGPVQFDKVAGISHKIARKIIEDKITEDEAIKLIATKEWQYARRQLTWFRRNKFICWFETSDEALKNLKEKLNT